MNLVRLSLSYIRQRTLSTLLNVVLLAMGFGTIVVLLLFSEQFNNSLERNADGIDLVVGAKGSPLQLILSSIYHMDVPTGNISVADAQPILQNRAVKLAIPMALGDSFRGYRIVGTSHDYPNHYNATLAEGVLWDGVGEVTLGAQLAADQGLGLGDEVISTHGLSEDGDPHGDLIMRVVGVLAPTGTVLDRLVLNSVETIWAVHGVYPSEESHADEHEDAGQEEAAMAQSDLPEAAAQQAGAADYTALLIQFASPLAVAMFPRFVNTQTNLQAASPAMEIARLADQLGVGVGALRVFGILLIAAAALSVFIALYNALKARRYDLAIMRSMGASQGKLVQHVLLEGLLLAGMGLMVGLALGHGMAEWLGHQFAQTRQMAMTGWTWAAGEWILVVIAIGVGFVAAILPAWQAYRTDIARVLARG